MQKTAKTKAKRKKKKVVDAEIESKNSRDTEENESEEKPTARKHKLKSCKQQKKDCVESSAGNFEDQTPELSELPPGKSSAKIIKLAERKKALQRKGKQNIEEKSKGKKQRNDGNIVSGNDVVDVHYADADEVPDDADPSIRNSSRKRQFSKSSSKEESGKSGGLTRRHLSYFHFISFIFITSKLGEHKIQHDIKCQLVKIQLNDSSHGSQHHI